MNFQKFSEFKISFDNIYFQITWFDRTLWNHSFWIILNHLGSSGEERRLDEHFLFLFRFPSVLWKTSIFLVSNFENFWKKFGFLKWEMDAFADIFRVLSCPPKRTKKKCPEIPGHALTIFQVKFQNFHSTVSCGILWSLQISVYKSYDKISQVIVLHKSFSSWIICFPDIPE